MEREDRERQRHSVTDPSGARKMYSRDILLQIEQRGHTFSREVALRLNDIIKSGTPGAGGGGGLWPNQMHYGDEVIPASENAWKPSKNKPLDENEKVLFDVRALLNKLTPTNYDKLIQSMTDEIPFHNTPERLQATVGLIFDKVLEEPNYADYTELYAKMCRDLNKTEAKDAKGEVVKFRTVLLQQTQRYFEKTQNEEEEAELEKNEGDPKALQPEKRVNAKRHYLGIIRFISELYKVELLTDRVILMCFQKLLPKKANFEDADEVKLECLCKLLQTCAKLIKDQLTVNLIFEQLQKMIDRKVSTSRIRFMMEDTIDLKNNNYTPQKTVQARPTTIEEVHAAYHNEKQKVRQAGHGSVQVPTRGALAGGRGGMMRQTGRVASSFRSAPGDLSAMGLIGMMVPHNHRRDPHPPMPSMETGTKKLKNTTLVAEERWGAPLASGTKARSVANPPCYLPAQEDLEVDCDAVDEPVCNMRARASCSDEQASGMAPVEVEGLLNIRDLINELTLRNYRTTARSILQWAPLLRTPESWSAIAALILTKAMEQSLLDRPCLCCAELCRELISTATEDGDFRFFLIHQTTEYIDGIINQKVAMEEAEGYCDDSEELQRKKTRIRRDHSNAVGFISELHKAGVLTNSDHLSDFASSVANHPMRSKTNESPELQEEQKIWQADRDQVQLPRYVQIPERGGMARRGGMMMPQTGREMPKPNSASTALPAMGGVPPRLVGRPATPSTETGKKKLIGLLDHAAVGPQRAQWGSQVAGTSSRSPVQEDVELSAEAVDELAGRLLQRAVNSEGEDSRDVINESVRIVRRWTGPTQALFIKSILGRSFDAKSQERARYPEFLMALAREGLFPQDVLADGLGLIVEDTSDIVVDVPRMYDYVVDLIGPLLLDGLLGAAALDGALNESPDHAVKYHGAFRKWLEFRLSPQQKKDLMTQGPVLWHKILWTEKRSRYG